MTFVVIGSCESPRRAKIKTATKEKISSVTSETRLQPQRGILSRKRRDNLRIKLWLYRKSSGDQISRRCG